MSVTLSSVFGTGRIGLSKRVLVLGARAPAALEWVRGLASLGFQVFSADSLACPVARFSCYNRSYTRLPEPRWQPQAWLEALVALVEREVIDWVIPTCEEVFYLAWGAARFNGRCRLFTANFEQLHSLHHKGHFAAQAQAWPVGAPDTRVIESKAALVEFSDQSSDLVFKPAYSRFANRTLIAPSPDALAQIHPSPQQPWVVQRRIRGKEFCSYSLVREGRLLAHSLYQPKYRVGQGSGIYFEVAESAAIEQTVSNFVATLGYTGQLACDWMRDGDGRYWALECNPRATSGVHLFDDQPQALAAALADTPAADIFYPNQTPRMLSLAMGLFGLPNWGRLQFWRDLSLARDVIYRPGDTGPLWAQLPGVAEISWRALSRRCGLLAAATADIEWDGQSLGEPQE